MQHPKYIKTSPFEPLINSPRPVEFVVVMIATSQLVFTWFALGPDYCLAATLELLGLCFSTPSTRAFVDWKDSSRKIAESTTCLGPAKHLSKVKVFILS